MPLHLTKVAFACSGIDVLHARQSSRVVNGAVPITTRFRPKREAELAGGSLFWILRHSLVARQAILGFDEARTEQGLRCLILLSADIVPVAPRALRAHQGWRYLEAADAPSDLTTQGDAGIMPAAMMRELTELALL